MTRLAGHECDRCKVVARTGFDYPDGWTTVMCVGRPTIDLCANCSLAFSRLLAMWCTNEVMRAFIKADADSTVEFDQTVSHL